MISTLYAAVARRRREWYAARPEARRRLRRPVISVGNIAAGGRGKTPFTAAVARILLDLGEIPAILSRGYAKTDPVDGAVVVRDRTGIRADVARAGDEPFMLAAELDGTIVISGPDRYLAGRLAEHHLGATVHVLDDGFQHFQLDRDVDIVLVANADLEDASTLPRGPLREPADVLIAADALVSVDPGPLDLPAETGLTRPDIDIPVFTVIRTTGAAVFDEGSAPPSGVPVLAVAGIANPAGFFERARAAGWQIAATRIFPDHYPYSKADLRELAGGMRAAGAAAILTTHKDYVRMLPHRPFGVPVGWLPLTMSPEPADAFRRWLSLSLASARDIVIG